MKTRSRISGVIVLVLLQISFAFGSEYLHSVCIPPVTTSQVDFELKSSPENDTPNTSFECYACCFQNQSLEVDGFCVQDIHFQAEQFRQTATRDFSDIQFRLPLSPRAPPCLHA